MLKIDPRGPNLPIDLMSVKNITDSTVNKKIIKAQEKNHLFFLKLQFFILV